METPLFGKNLCNLLCNLIIENYDVVDSNHKTEIKVIDLEQFIVLKGKTSINNPINYSIIFKSFIEEKNNSNKNFNVIDLIEYGVNPSSKIINLDVTFNNNQNYSIFNLHHTIQGEYHIDYDKNLILHNNNKLFEFLLGEPEFNDFEGSNMGSSYPFVSDDLFGKNLNSSKLYEIYLRYISYNLFEKQLCKDINFKVFYSGEITDLSWETMSFNIDSGSNVTSKDWMASLVLDLFDFNYSYIKKHLSLDDYDFSNEILSKDRCWMKRDKTSEMILF
jgi:hypothetical protein